VSDQDQLAALNRDADEFFTSRELMGRLEDRTQAMDRAADDERVDDRIRAALGPLVDDLRAYRDNLGRGTFGTPTSLQAVLHEARQLEDRSPEATPERVVAAARRVKDEHRFDLSERIDRHAGVVRFEAAAHSSSSDTAEEEAALSSDEHSHSDSSPDAESGARISTRAKAIIASVTALVTLATGVLTLRDQLFPSDDQTGGDSGTVADVTNDAEAKSLANRVSDALKECVVETGRDYLGCDTGGILGAIQVPIGSGMGSVEVNVSSGFSYELTSRSESGNIFLLQKTVEGEEVRTCTPPGSGGCPPDGRW
jgi:hypothetical protein